MSDPFHLAEGDAALTSETQANAPHRRGPGRPATVRPPPSELTLERRSELAHAMLTVREQLRTLNSSDLTTSERIERLLSLNFSLMLPLFGEALSEIPDMNRSAACARAMTALKDTVAIVAKRHELETTDAFNPRSPKFTVVFGWFVELVHRTLCQHADDTTVANVFNDLSGELTGWEDRIERQLKGVAAKTLATLPSPFTQDFLERLQATAAGQSRAAVDPHASSAGP
jgi:hypothetical protein